MRQKGAIPAASAAAMQPVMQPAAETAKSSKEREKKNLKPKSPRFQDPKSRNPPAAENPAPQAAALIQAPVPAPAAPRAPPRHMTMGESTFETIQVIPKPLAAKQDVKTLLKDGIKGGVEELIDNSIHAVLSPLLKSRLTSRPGQARKFVPRIWVKFVDSTNDREAALIVQDNGLGMNEMIMVSPVIVLPLKSLTMVHNILYRETT